MFTSRCLDDENLKNFVVKATRRNTWQLYLYIFILVYSPTRLSMTTFLLLPCTGFSQCEAVGVYQIRHIKPRLATKSPRIEVCEYINCVLSGNSRLVTTRMNAKMESQKYSKKRKSKGNPKIVKIIIACVTGYGISKFTNWPLAFKWLK